MEDRPISDYAVIGDGLAAALVSRAGAVDWLCWPRFDSPALFCRLLDAERGGSFALAPAARAGVVRRYLPETAILESLYRDHEGAVRVIDFMPVDDLDAGGDRSPRRLVRHIECLAGRARIALEFRPTFDFARAEVRAEGTSFGAVASSADETVSLRAPVPLRGEGDGLGARLELAAGEAADLVLTLGMPAAIDVATARAETEACWRRWSTRCRYSGRWQTLVNRSAITLKLLTYRPTGALIAAPTTSLPECVGGERNWDYRYAWLRDAALALAALQRLGYHGEAMRFWGWLEALCLRCGCDAQSLYRIDGARVDGETTLDHLAGWRGSRPVRIGNAAATQLQLDVLGEIVDAAWFCMRSMRTPHPHLAPVLRSLADRAASGWTAVDHGIWEVRDRQRHFVHSKLGCWLALDRALRLARDGWLAGDVSRWRSAQGAIASAVRARGLRPDGALARAFDDPSLDASVLLASRMGFLRGDDPRMLATITAIQRGLVDHGLVRRYEGSDGLEGKEGAFLPCSFWLVDALVLAGRREEAEELFAGLLERANDVGLLAEEVDPGTGELLGNFPQALSHLALIRSAVLLAGAQ